jgi:hypothetical protein
MFFFRRKMPNKYADIQTEVPTTTNNQKFLFFPKNKKKIPFYEKMHCCPVPKFAVALMMVTFGCLLLSVLFFDGVVAPSFDDVDPAPPPRPAGNRELGKKK